MRGSSAQRLRLEEELVDAVILHPRRKLVDHLEHPAAEDLVPAKVAFDVDALRTLHQGVPDRLAGLDAGCLHLVALGNDERSLVAEDADRLAVEEIIAHALGRDVETVGVEVANGIGAGHKLAPDIAQALVPGRSHYK
jgi:hypothetical protein